MNNKAFEVNFGWLFAIVAGAMIIVLSIYGVSKLGTSERTLQDSEMTQQLGIVLNPLETGSEEGKTTPISFSVNSRIILDCKTPNSVYPFGLQVLGVSTQSGIGEKWQNLGLNYSVQNKYVFGTTPVEGRNFVILTKPFEMPFKVADIMVIIEKDSDYCFVNAPASIESELIDLGLNGTILFTSDKKQCKGRVSICFSATGCDADVFIDSKIVSKKGKIMYYEGSLIYAAIFSQPPYYECQVNRLLKRTSEISNLYLGKSNLLSARGGCSSALQPLIENLINITSSGKSENLRNIALNANDLKEVNDDAVSCRLF
jgi:hypothetical protein